MRLIRSLFLFGFACAGSVVGGAVVVEVTADQERHRPFHAVVGLWSAGANGEWTTDGATWTGTHTPEDISAAGKALYNTREGNVALWGYGNGRRRVVARGTGKAQLPLGEWHQLTVTVDGTSVTGRTGDLTMTHTLEAPVSGRVGLWTKRDSVTSFRNYTARAR